jgi:flagellar biogenesis protein FliO
MPVVGLGGTALFLRRRRKVTARAVRSDLDVLSAVRVGAKAEVVVVSVGGRKVLLGVTDAQVSQLGWLDDELEGSTLPEAVPAFEAAAWRPMLEAARPSPSPAPETAARAPAPPRRFRDALLSALGQNVRPEPVNAALAIAETTEDVISRSNGRSPVRPPAGAPAMLDVEGQAKGLVLRLQKRA